MTRRRASGRPSPRTSRPVVTFTVASGALAPEASGRSSRTDERAAAVRKVLRTLTRRTGRAAALALGLWLAFSSFAHAAPARVSELTRHVGDIPRRIVGYGIVTGLDGTGDRSFGRGSAGSPSVRSVANLLRRFQIEVPAEQLRLRDVAAVLVTAEVSPWLRPGGRFDVEVSALGDATSLRGGTLWITPLVTDPGEPAIATAQGSLLVTSDREGGSVAFARTNRGRILSGGVLEVDQPVPAADPRLLMQEPDLRTASLVAAAIDSAFGAGTATLEDAGSLVLKVPTGIAPALWLAAVDTVQVLPPEVARVVIDARDGTVVAGGALRVTAAVVSRGGVTLQIGGAGGAPSEGLVRMPADASVQEVAAGLHAAGARGPEIAAVFESLRSAGALRAQVVVR
jgi:flagellar P-ring protein precursor FlgI